MSNYYLIDYIKKHSNIDKELLGNLKFDLDGRIYYYGQQFKFPYEGKWLLRHSLLYEVKSFLKSWYIYAKIILNNPRNDRNKKNILSNSYFTINDELRNLGYRVYSPIWSANGDRNMLADINLYNKTKQLQGILRKGEFKELLSGKFIKEICAFRDYLKKFIIKSNLAALFLPYDMPFFENISIKTFAELKRPSFIFLHGLPARYSAIEDNRSDYLIVWGERIKENYVRAGVNADKIFISGHPCYKEFNVKKLRFGYDDILVITKSVNGNQYSDGVVLSDRGNLIVYLYSIQNALLKLGVRSVRIRPHPSENHMWYKKFIDTDFFKFDEYPLTRSLQKASLVVGPSSSVFLEAAFYGVNYMLYEPCSNNIDLINFKLVPPFDGSDPRIPVAKSEEELTSMLKNRTSNSPSFFSDYIKTPFDISFIKKII